MVWMLIRLVGDNIARPASRIEFDKQILYTDLKKEIESVTGIPPKFQHLQFRNEDLPIVKNPLSKFEEIEFGEEIHVKHSFLDHWQTYLEHFEETKNYKNKERTTLAQTAIEISKLLHESKFFVAYTSFTTTWAESIEQMTRLLDRTSVAFKESAKKFFNKKFPNSTLNFKEKTGGTRSGIVVTVTCDGKDTTYFMKTFHQAGTSCSYSSMKRHPPDLREMFAYRLLQIIGVGPVVFFPYYEGSTTILTEKVKEFTEVDKIEDVALQKKVVVESYLLSLILGIRDLNIGNIGSNQQKDLAIVDFCVTNGVNFVERKIVNNFLNKNNFDVPDISHETLANIGHEERRKIAKDALAKWSQISTITSDIISDEKRELRKHGIVFGNATDDVESYIEDIKLNYNSIFLASR